MSARITIYALLIFSALAIITLWSQFSYDSVITETPPIEHVSLQGLSADVWGIFDIKTGEVLQGSNDERVVPIASITKLFTAYSALQSSDIDQQTMINWNDLDTEGRAGKLSHGEWRTSRELLFPLLIESSNDAGEAIRRNIGSDFERSIDSLSFELGLEDTIIVDGSGLSSGNVSTARELALVYAYLNKHASYILDISQLQLYIAENTGWVNNNPARAYDEFIGGKHGFTDEAGRTLLAGFRLESGREIGVVLLGSADLTSDIEIMLQYLNKEY